MENEAIYRWTAIGSLLVFAGVLVLTHVSNRHWAERHAHSTPGWFRLTIEEFSKFALEIIVVLILLVVSLTIGFNVVLAFILGIVMLLGIAPVMTRLVIARFGFRSANTGEKAASQHKPRVPLNNSQRAALVMANLGVIGGFAMEIWTEYRNWGAEVAKDTVLTASLFVAITFVISVVAWTWGGSRDP